MTNRNDLIKGISKVMKIYNRANVVKAIKFKFSDSSDNGILQLYVVPKNNRILTEMFARDTESNNECEALEEAIASTSLLFKDSTVNKIQVTVEGSGNYYFDKENMQDMEVEY